MFGSFDVLDKQYLECLTAQLALIFKITLLQVHTALVISIQKLSISWRTLIRPTFLLVSYIQI